MNSKKNKFGVRTCGYYKEALLKSILNTNKVLIIKGF